MDALFYLEEHILIINNYSRVNYIESNKETMENAVILKEVRLKDLDEFREDLSLRSRRQQNLHNNYK
jgi:hypothetical protein